MKQNRRIIAIALLLAISIIATQCGCPIPVQNQVKIASNYIYLQSPPKPAVQYQITPIQYVHNHKQAFVNVPSTAIGLGGFDFQKGTNAAIQAQVVRKEQTSSNFKLAVNYNSNWQSLKVAFLSTDRSDIQIGETSIAGPINSDTFSLAYNFRNKWANANYLRYKVFISGFSLRTNQQDIIRVSLEKADVSSTGISLLYSTKLTATILDSLSVSLIIFDGYNPALRFSEGVITQSFVSTKISVSVPKQGVSEIRNSIAGLTSFEVASVNIAVSVNSQFNSDFSLQLGPTQNNCKINLLSISYLILSVYQECGACYPNVYSYSNKCIDKCPNGHFISAGRCIPKTCQPGFYLVQNSCLKCPKYSDIKQCNNACPVGTKLSGEDCLPICTRQYEVYSYNSCVCAQGFYRINGVCSKCQKGTKYDYCSQTCVSICPSNAVYLPQTDSCLCNNGYNWFHGRCVQCRQGEVFDNTWGCHKSCPPTLNFNGKDCVCPFGQNLIAGACSRCKEDEVYNPSQQSCFGRCPANQVWQANGCVCRQGFYRINGYCTKCREGQVYEQSLNACRPACTNGQVWVGGKCQCLPGSYFINNNCQLCPVEKRYDPATKQCQNVCKLQYQYFNNGICNCLRSYQRAASGECRPKQCPDNSAYNYAADSCICNAGYLLSPKTGQCQKVPTCPPYSTFVNGYCVCNNGWFMNQDNTACIQCNASRFEVFNGQRCVCADGYVIGPDGSCRKVVLPVCGVNQYFDQTTRNCYCKTGFDRVNGACIKPPTCKQNQYWNGQSCSCSPGFILNKANSKCQKVPQPIPIPNCPYNSNFNGVKCVCNDRFFEFQPGVCATCPPLMTWNGKKCAYSKSCWVGYRWDQSTECCVAVGPACPQNSKWNGQACQCDVGYNAVGSTCIKCQRGFQFDGSKCSRVPKPIQCTAVNTVAVNGRCVCRAGTHLYNNNCIQCTYPTVWNGYYCQGNVDACLSVPYSVLDPTNNRCKCLPGYRACEGTCVPIPGYLNQNGYIYTWSEGYRWNGGANDNNHNSGRNDGQSKKISGNNHKDDNKRQWQINGNWGNNQKWENNGNWGFKNNGNSFQNKGQNTNQWNGSNNGGYQWNNLNNRNSFGFVAKKGKQSDPKKRSPIALPPFLPSWQEGSTHYTVYKN